MRELLGQKGLEDAAQRMWTTLDRGEGLEKTISTLADDFRSSLGDSSDPLRTRELQTRLHALLFRVRPFEAFQTIILSFFKHHFGSSSASTSSSASCASGGAPDHSFDGLCRNLHVLGLVSLDLHLHFRFCCCQKPDVDVAPHRSRSRSRSFPRSSLTRSTLS